MTTNSYLMQIDRTKIERVLIAGGWYDVAFTESDEAHMPVSTLTYSGDSFQFKVRGEGITIAGLIANIQAVAVQ